MAVIRGSGMRTGLGEPGGARRLSRAGLCPACSGGFPKEVPPAAVLSPGAPRQPGALGPCGGSERSPQVPGSSPRGTPDPLSGCAGTVPVGFVARLLIEGSGRFFILPDCISGVEWPRFF